MAEHDFTSWYSHPTSYPSSWRRGRIASNIARWGGPLLAGGSAWALALLHEPHDARRAEAASAVSATVAAGGGRLALCSAFNSPTCVVDGDTIRDKGVRIRLVDIDTPETYKFQCAAEEALGHRATARLVALLNEGAFEIVSAGNRDTDVYGRKLRLIMRNGHSLGDRLVAEGLARRWEGHRRSWCG